MKILALLFLLGPSLFFVSGLMRNSKPAAAAPLAADVTAQDHHEATPARSTSEHVSFGARDGAGLSPSAGLALSGASAETLEQLAQRVAELEREVVALRTDLAETRLRLGEVEAPYLPGNSDRQPPAGTAVSPASVPATSIAETPAFKLINVRRFQGEAQAYVLLPGSSESTVVTARAPLYGWYLAGVDVSRRSAIFSKGRENVELLAQE